MSVSSLHAWEAREAWRAFESENDVLLRETREWAFDERQRAAAGIDERSQFEIGRLDGQTFVKLCRLKKKQN